MKTPRKSTPGGSGRARIVIGSRYTGKYAGHLDTTTGTYWEALPQIGGDALALQRCLLARREAPRTRGPLLAATLRRLVPQRLDPATGIMRGAK